MPLATEDSHVHGYPSRTRLKEASTPKSVKGLPSVREAAHEQPLDGHRMGPGATHAARPKGRRTTFTLPIVQR